MQTENKLFVGFNQPINPSMRLFCFPYAGAGAGIFSDWANYFPAEIEVIGIQLPGRETRINEPLFTDLSELIDELAAQITDYLILPFAFFGHSMGALISFELARKLRQQKLPEPAYLFVAGFRAPHSKDIDPPMHQLCNRDLIEDLKKLGGTTEVIAEHAELMELLLPAIRQDIKLCETYEYKNEELLSCPIHALGGLNDKKVRREQLENWQSLTCGSFDLSMFRGDHFFILSNKIFLNIISSKLTQLKKRPQHE